MALHIYIILDTVDVDSILYVPYLYEEEERREGKSRGSRNRISVIVPSYLSPMSSSYPLSPQPHLIVNPSIYSQQQDRPDDESLGLAYCNSSTIKSAD